MNKAMAGPVKKAGVVLHKDNSPQREAAREGGVTIQCEMERRVSRRDEGGGGGVSHYLTLVCSEDLHHGISTASVLEGVARYSSRGTRVQ